MKPQRYGATDNEIRAYTERKKNIIFHDDGQRLTHGICLVRHPQGWHYLVAYNDTTRTLRNSTLLVALWPDGEKIGTDGQEEH